MSNLASVLKNEITRLARKETRAQVEPLRKASAIQRREIAELKRLVAVLSRQSRSTSKKPLPAPNGADQLGSARFSAKGLRALRQRLGLSAAHFGSLAGASGQSVYNWEAGKTVPRDSQRKALAGLRSLGKKEAQARLAAQ